MKTFDFYGVCGNRYKLDDIVWEAMENKSDGYRSYLGSIDVSAEKSSDIFFAASLGKVYVSKCADPEGWQIVDEETGHVLLRIGTDYGDNHYPCFRFVCAPKDPSKYNQDGTKKEWETFISE